MSAKRWYDAYRVISGNSSTNPNLGSKKDSPLQAVSFREGISFLWGIAKNYIMYWGGYAYYNTTGIPFCISPKITNITICIFYFCAYLPNTTCEYIQRAGSPCPFLIHIQISLKLFPLSPAFLQTVPQTLRG
mgnify:CR=1 FL=1